MHIIVFIKILSSTTVSIIMIIIIVFIEQQFSILESFLKDRVTLKIGVMMLKM